MRVLSRVVALAVPVLVSGCAWSAESGEWHLEPLVTNFGIGTLLHPIQEPEAVAHPGGCDARSGHCCKEHVYIFGVNGLNPLCLGNFNGMLRYFRQQGFTNTYFGQLYTSHGFACEIRRIRQEDPQARVVVIGFSWGANYAKAIANCLNKDGTRIDLLVYLVGDLVWNSPDSKPANVCRVVNIRAKGLVLLGGDLLFNGADIEGARNHMLHCRHILAPSRKETLALLMEELLALACTPGPPAGPALLPPAPAATAPAPARP
jgi:hypothetical protein